MATLFGGMRAQLYGHEMSHATCTTLGEALGPFHVPAELWLTSLHFNCSTEHHRPPGRPCPTSPPPRSQGLWLTYLSWGPHGR